MLRDGVDYQEKGGDYFYRRNRSRVVTSLIGRLTGLGYYVSLQPATEPFPPSIGEPAAHSRNSPGVNSTSPPQPKDTPRRRGRPCKCSSPVLLGVSADSGAV